MTLYHEGQAALLLDQEIHPGDYISLKRNFESGASELKHRNNRLVPSCWQLRHAFVTLDAKGQLTHIKNLLSGHEKLCCSLQEIDWK